MPKMIVSIDGVVIKEVQLTKDRTTLGRRPYNDIVIDNLAVSGEHAVLQLTGNEVYLEDLNSTNGTYVNGKAVKKQLLQNNDTVEIGKYKIKFINEAPGVTFEKTMIMKAGSVPPIPKPAAPAGGAPQPATAGASAVAGAAPAEVAAALNASIKVLSGAAAGREVPLVKVVTTIGKPGVAVAAITKRSNGFVVAHVEGANKPTLNGAAIGPEPVTLKNGDMLELAGTQMQFVQAA
ncbi:FHA domain-containing protein [Caenimonas sedimenti]|jgi:pSer/pThr/pTyr-binding forkhead associated (FHA) protein|uniref:FHA domain-containing protein n=1 Tax=Caenimonas sedimenti TaxID=2596921 RepID=A0A562ZGD6_9BURK|nr:FHA domain-containing protein [Caenimonas sedimenti]TWO66660.1 FHA domain-containing protein [Caenimonas sedimenti]